MPHPHCHRNEVDAVDVQTTSVEKLSLLDMTSLMLAGLGIAGAALALRVLSGSMKRMQQHASKISKSSSAFTTYYRGGFEPRMTRREAGLILGKSVYLNVMVRKN